ncbi:MAG: ATP-binding protein [Lutibacter sp.]
MDNIAYKIRPAARLIHTIGSDLIGDSYAALVELVKNSYDADSSKVDINFEYKLIDNSNALVITVVDDGHGMSFETIINKWLVPATADKLIRKESPIKKRKFQGQKGIGRFAASILGQEMTLTSIDEKGEKSTIIIDWRIFKTDEYLENIELLVEKEKTNEESGTFIEIIAKDEQDDYKISSWDKNSIEELTKELRKLISPFEDFDNDIFKISLSFTNSPFSDEIDENISIETYPIIELYDYRISGTIKKNGDVKLLFENNVDPEVKQSEMIETNYVLEEKGKYCGEINIDFRVFDREPEAIHNLINKGLIDPVTKKYMGSLEAKRELNSIYGVNIYKSFFRIRPYGNAGVDWLKLDNRRIQNPSQKIGNNQIVGFITIQPEEYSNLQEKSARDGLKENEYFFGLKELADKALSEIETRRYTFRKRSQKSRSNRTSIKDDLSNLFSFTDLSKSIENKLEQFNVTKDNISQITSILKNEEESKAGLLEDIQKTIAIYQGQATLGKIVNFILHEGRKPLQFFNSETIVIERYLRHYKATKDEEILKELIESIDGFKKNSKLLSELFRRVNPLAKQKRGSKVDFKLIDTIKDSEKIFGLTLDESKIIFDIDCKENLTLFGWEEDLFIALTNLIENSIYWLNLSKKENKKISISVTQIEDSIKIDYKDNGKGLTDIEIESDIIFEPGYSKKLNGTGLGLAIAGEAIERLNGKLTARKYDKGVYFQIEVNR